MLHVGLDLSRRRLDYLALADNGERVDAGAAPPDADGLRGLAGRIGRDREPVRAVIESMNGARFVHDTLERYGWEVEVADAQKVRGLAPLACKTDRIDTWVLAELSRLSLVPAIWLPDPTVRAERERARWRLYRVRQRSRLKQRVHSTLMAWGMPCPVADLFGARGRERNLGDGAIHPGRRPSVRAIRRGGGQGFEPRARDPLGDRSRALAATGVHARRRRPHSRAVGGARPRAGLPVGLTSAGVAHA